MMEPSRIKVLYGGLIFQLLFVIALPLPYTKYGRTCSDIGCLSSQVCVMAYESCSLGQRDGNDCGRYPTCKKNTDPSVSAGPSAGASNVFNNGPKPPAPVAGNDDDVLGSLGLNPNNPYGQRPTPAPTRPRPPSAPQGPSLYPSLPTDNGPGNRYGNNGGGGGGGGYSPGGAGGYGGRPAAPGSFDGSGGNIVVPTQKPAAPSSGGGFFGGILSGVQNAVSNAVKQQIGTYINQRLGIGPAAGGAAGSGGLGGLFDARNFVDNKRLGGLFAENKPAGGSSPSSSSSSSSVPAGSAIGPGGYPVTVDQRTSASNYNQQYAPQSQYAQNYRHQSAASNGRARSTERPAYGWTNV
ncbi:translation initiation factor IF-2-like [Anopheles cruzii]|uniref:translation initiation factor IF-2-like n=1 Tax=Anopheles cruzii TaxID=68878 RepID=UPI0022EC6526|nr:translation initiation factor IF-2-like [Anopheles cruzii]